MATALRAFFTAIVIACSSCVLPSFAQAPGNQTAILAGGCFWCVQSDFDKLKGKGVVATLAGYTGGTIEHPTYQDYHDSGEGIVPHVEAVRVTYDPAKIRYADLLEYYVHHSDPARQEILAGGRLPPGIPREEPATLSILPLELRSRSACQGAVGEIEV
jgi:hypothetical protein